MDIYKKLSEKKNLKVRGSINGHECIGLVIFNNTSYYFLQNNNSGSVSKVHHLYSYKYRCSWKFNIVKNKRSLTDGVQIFEIISEEDGLKDTDFNKIKRVSIIELSKSTPQHTRSMRLVHKDQVLYKNGDTIEKFEKDIKSDCLFTIKPHPDCCGCSILFQFDTSREYRYSKYQTLSYNDYKDIHMRLMADNPAKIAHLAEYQTCAIKFVEYLGFERVYKYINKNSKNTIYVYHFNPNEPNKYQLNTELLSKNNIINKTQNSDEKKEILNKKTVDKVKPVKVQRATVESVNNEDLPF